MAAQAKERVGVGASKLVKRMVLAAALAVLATAAAAQELPGWAAQRVTSGDGWVMISADDEHVAYVRAARPSREGVVEQRVERAEPAPGRFRYLSMWSAIRVDCAGGRMTPTEIVAWSRNNLSGERNGGALSREVPWITPEADSVGGETVAWACDPANGVVAGSGAAPSK